MRGRGAIFPIAAGLLVTGCAAVPTGPSVLVLPGTTKSFEQFQVDDAQCRQWTLEQTGTTPNRAGAASTATGAAVGTAAGAGNAYGAGASAQNKYDIGYVQCMYAKGNQAPVPQGSKPAYTSAAIPPPSPPPGPVR